MAEIRQQLLDGGIDISRGTFTMTSNYLYDEVVPKLKRPVEKLILFLMERKTVGFHTDSADVSVEDMVKFTGASRSSVQRARRQLIKDGYLVVLSPGTGLKKTRYTRDFEPERQRGDARQDAGSEKIIDAPEPPVEKVSEIKGVQDEPVHAPEESAQDPPEQKSGGSAPEDAEKANKIKGIQDDPAFKDLKDLNTGSGRNKKTDKDTEKKENENLAPDTKSQKPDSQKKVVASVCSSLRSFGFSVERRDYAFVGWCYNCYGVQALKEKLRIMKLQIMRGVKLINPFAWLRAALARNYQYARSDAERARAAERTQRARERSERQRQEWDQRRAEVEAEQNDPATQARIAEVQAAFWRTVGAEAV